MEEQKGSLKLTDEDFDLWEQISCASNSDISDLSSQIPEFGILTDVLNPLWLRRDAFAFYDSMS